MNYIKQIATKKVDSETHEALVRYGKGDFVKEELIITISKKNIRIQGGLDMVNPIQRFVASVCTEDAHYKGTIPTAKDVETELDSLGVGYEAKRRYGKSGAKYEIDTPLSPAKALEFINKLYEFYLLLNVKSGGNSIKVKKQDTPKIGSLVPKFVTGEVSGEHLDKVKEEFLFDVDASTLSKAKKITITHTIDVEDIILDEKLLKSDPLKARLEAKRKGTLRRKIDIGGDVVLKEYEFEV